MKITIQIPESKDVYLHADTNQKKVYPIRWSAIVKPIILFLLLLFMLRATEAKGQTVISGGPVYGSWTAAGSPYKIYGDVEIPQDSLLIIEAGVDVEIFTELEFLVKGSLIAAGSDPDPVSFYPVMSPYWKGLYFLNADTSVLSFCSFEGFTSKTSTYYGLRGGVIRSISSPIYILNSNFNNNAIMQTGFVLGYPNAEGGAIYISDGWMRIDNCSFAGNKIIVEVTEIYVMANGGGICSKNSDLIVTNCTFESNEIKIENTGLLMDPTSIARGGAIYAEGNCTILNSDINANIVDVHTVGWDDIMYPFFVQSESISEGGGIFSIGGNLINSVITNNLCKSFSEAYSTEGDCAKAESNGGGSFCSHTVNCVLKFNCLTASAIAITTITNCEGAGQCNGLILNSILWNNTGAPQVEGSSATFSCIQGGYTGQGNIGYNPMFVSGPLGNNYLSQTAAGQAQQSPCVDAGDPSTPLFGGTTRTDHVPDQGVVDMGYHYLASSSEPPVADFMGVPRYIDMFEHAYFFNLTLQTAASVKWIFEGGDPAVSWEQNPIVQYNLPGTFDASLVVWNTVGCDTLIRHNYITVACTGANVLFNASDTLVVLNDTVIFTDYSCVDPYSWNWEFEGGAPGTSTQQNPAVFYSDTGSFDVKLVIESLTG
ncbi:MAG: PKD domain-containing protein [Bacteroidales bacterium]|nr:PKD domain-containing protein [Bacteroidales bacterium]